MATVAFVKATDPPVTDIVRINPGAVLYAEASTTEQLGQSVIHMMGQDEAGIFVTAPIAEVVAAVGAGMVAAVRHYRAAAPAEGSHTVYIAPGLVSMVRPATHIAPAFWAVHFCDGTELRIIDPPEGL